MSRVARCIVRRIALQGSAQILPAPYSASTLSEAALHETPGGVYAAFGTWHDRRVIQLTKHLDRLEDSARRLGFDLAMDRPLVRRELCAMMEEAGFRGARIRISVVPAPDGGAHEATAAMEPYDGPPLSLREHGVKCRTAEHAARSNPRAKQTSWIVERARLSDRKEAPYEWLLLDDSRRVMEGASSNFYIVTAGKLLMTAGEGVLEGIARSIVLDVAQSVVPVRLEAPPLGEVRLASEAFLTSASRGIVPIVSIDASAVGSGTPGPVTLQLIQRYDERAHELEERVCD